jgi:cytochrome c-type biogenesis protein CcmH/NrfG
LGVGKKAKQTTSMVVKVQCSLEPPAGTHHEPNEQWITRIGQLQDALAVCPSDLSARSELAALLEKLGQLEEALFNWNAVLTCDPNSLNAREGVARCRQRTGPPLQSAQ